MEQHTEGKHFDVVAGPAEGGALPPLAAPLPTPFQPTNATVGVPTTATDELSKLVPANGQVGGLTVVLAAIAVLGGGAAWKFYSQRSKERHEEKLKEMELQASQPAAQHPSCKAENEALQTELRKLNESVGGLTQRIQNVTERITKLEAQIESPDLPEGLADFDDRLKKVERALKAAKTRKT